MAKKKKKVDLTAMKKTMKRVTARAEKISELRKPAKKKARKK